MNKYVPKPIDTSDIVLNEDLLGLCEKLAENTHEVWARGRMDEGWKYGEARNDEKKETVKQSRESIRAHKKETREKIKNAASSHLTSGTTK